MVRTKPYVRVEVRKNARPVGETDVERARRTGAYEQHRANFTQWLTEGRSYSWICAKTEFSRTKVCLIVQALELTHLEAAIDERAKRAPQPRAPRQLPTTVLEWRVEERAFQRMRIANCSAWDRGW